MHRGIARALASGLDAVLRALERAARARRPACTAELLRRFRAGECSEDFMMRYLAGGLGDDAGCNYAMELAAVERELL